jgi:hypothetical protein
LREILVDVTDVPKYATQNTGEGDYEDDRPKEKRLRHDQMNQRNREGSKAEAQPKTPAPKQILEKEHSDSF